MDNKKWQVLLDAASDASSVAAICEQFRRTWTDAELKAIPASCRPPEAIEPDDIAPYAIRLIAEIGAGNRTTTPLLYAMSTFFTKAALRVAELEAPRPPPRTTKHGRSGSSQA